MEMKSFAKKNHNAPEAAVPSDKVSFPTLYLPGDAIPELMKKECGENCILTVKATVVGIRKYGSGESEVTLELKSGAIGK